MQHAEYAKALVKVSSSCWITANEACLTQTELQRVGMVLCSRGSMCEEKANYQKTVVHDFQLIQPKMGNAIDM